MNGEQYRVMRSPRGKILVIGLVAIIAVASIAVLTAPRPKIIVYTYDSFMVWGDDPESIDDIILGPFERAYGVDVEIVRLQTDATGIVARLVAEAQRPIADVVIGIDNILILREQTRAVLEPYTPDNLSVIDPELISMLDSEHYLLPFDYGVVCLVYPANVINETTHPQLTSLNFDHLATVEFASMLVTENPHFSSPGLSFLLSEIAYYEKLNNANWTDWWASVRGHINVQEGWSQAWTVWYEDPTRHLLVSYGTDPAYSAYYAGGVPDIRAVGITHNGTVYGWLQVEGIGLVKGGPHPELGRALIDYFLSAEVQRHIPLNQWMFPANRYAPLPAVFDYALQPGDVTPFNTLFTPTEIATNLASWLDEWDAIMLT
ncbi:MAG: thiamine ABC transporter substrate-binding protein [Candidatus Thorarchaeota archaeon]